MGFVESMTLRFYEHEINSSSCNLSLILGKMLQKLLVDGKEKEQFPGLYTGVLVAELTYRSLSRVEESFDNRVKLVKFRFGVADREDYFSPWRNSKSEIKLKVSAPFSESFFRLKISFSCICVP